MVQTEVIRLGFYPMRHLTNPFLHILKVAIPWGKWYLLWFWFLFARWLVTSFEHLYRCCGMLICVLWSSIYKVLCLFLNIFLFIAVGTLYIARYQVLIKHIIYKYFLLFNIIFSLSYFWFSCYRNSKSWWGPICVLSLLSKSEFWGIVPKKSLPHAIS